jgi:hypothetical protein
MAWARIKNTRHMKRLRRNSLRDGTGNFFAPIREFDVNQVPARLPANGYYSVASPIEPHMVS